MYLYFINSNKFSGSLLTHNIEISIRLSSVPVAIICKFYFSKVQCNLSEPGATGFLKDCPKVKRTCYFVINNVKRAEYHFVKDWKKRALPY